MAEPLLLSARRGIIGARLAKTYMATWPLVAALRSFARPIAARRPSAQVPPAVHAEAAALLAAARHVLSRQPGMGGNRLTLGESCDWATLVTELEFAMTGFEAFRTRYADFDDDVGGLVWRDRDWRNFVFGKRESASHDKALDEK